MCSRCLFCERCCSYALKQCHFFLRELGCDPQKNSHIQSSGCSYSILTLCFNFQKNRKRRNRKKKNKKKKDQDKKVEEEVTGNKEKEPEVEIEYITEEPEIYDPNFIFFKRIFEAFKVRPLLKL